MNTQPYDTKTMELMTLLDAVTPIFNDLQIIFEESKKLDSKYKNSLHHLSLYFKMDSIKNNERLTEDELEKKVKHICIVLEGIGKVMTQISSNEEESKLFLEKNIFEKLQVIAQRFSKLQS